MKMQLHSDETECVFSFFVTVKAAILERKNHSSEATVHRGLTTLFLRQPQQIIVSSTGHVWQTVIDLSF